MAQVHLTFDNGPHPEVTPRVLAELARRGLPASFFVLGQHLATGWGQAQARAIVAAGHRIGNHSYTHQTPLGDDPRPDAVARELADTQALLDPLLGDGPRWFRPFGGGGHLGPHLLSPQATRWLLDGGFTVGLWDVVPGDWLDAEGWVDAALGALAGRAQAVVVLHDILPQAMAHLPRFLDGLAAAGHAVVDTWPTACLPMVAGEARPELAACVRGGWPPP